MKRTLLILIFLGSFFCFSQELPPIVKYQSGQYGAGNQNWMVSQDKKNIIYFANNEGLLEFNGANFTLYPSPNETIIRSVKVINDKIYSGCYMEFGYWKRKPNGKLCYYSLSKFIKKQLIDDEQFWNIFEFDQWVVFQSLNRMYIYDTKQNSYSIITASSGIVKSFKTAHGIYFQTNKEGLFEIDNGKSELVSNLPLFLNSKIVNGFEISDGLLIQTQFDGMFTLKKNVLSKFFTDSDSELESSNIYSCLQLKNKNLVLGTVSKGIFILSENGKLQYHINQNKGLNNNTALSLFEDVDLNLWIGLDNGINCINLNSPIKRFLDDTGLLGTVYASIIFEGNLYIGTNQGLFYKKYLVDDDFKFISGTKGQVWSLFKYQNKLLCGHDSGTFLIKNNAATSIFNQSGTWKFSAVPNNPNLLLQGNYHGISILESRNGQLFFKNKIKGFDYSSKYFEILPNLEVYVSHEYKGIFRFQLNQNLEKTSAVYTYTTPEKGKNASLNQFNSQIFYASKNGVFRLNAKTKNFSKETQLSKVFLKDEYTSGKMMVDSSNKIWFFSKNYLHFFNFNKMNNLLKQNSISIPSSLINSMFGYENIMQLQENNYLIGTTDGYYVMDISDLNYKNGAVSITEVYTINQKNETKFLDVFQKGEVNYNNKELQINFTVPEFNKYINTEFQYQLTDYQKNWSDWSPKSSISFKNLPYGNYIFKVKAKIANSILDPIAIYEFKILKPWYRSNLMMFLYLLTFLFCGYNINKLYKNYYLKKEQKLIEENNLLLEIKELENQQELMKLKNEELVHNVDIKNRELAVSNMSLINKNELLSIIKEDLKKSNEGQGSKSIKSVISVINKNINEEDSWNVFKDAFDNVDKDFLKKLKQLHISLTPNDLRLCAYLRLNLSSKEIAPLISISVRSVEIKRYRLRKKMNLEHEQGLVEYILSV